ncbi:hypothetical protein [Deinococcus soli (ex Cha et al. 2016)]|uniref:hypothetical protein n=1 Tax=Deinococcus soli (ex Cha et al. 2016) TaxID=1309411 RepID=UPI000B294F6E|nr:hypothetical protein [Deinococcus soli (ex Cha et al. 2016)]
MKPELWTVVLVVALALAGFFLLRDAPTGVLMPLALVIVAGLAQRLQGKGKREQG